MKQLNEPEILLIYDSYNTYIVTSFLKFKGIKYRPAWVCEVSEMFMFKYNLFKIGSNFKTPSTIVSRPSSFSTLYTFKNIENF